MFIKPISVITQIGQTTPLQGTGAVSNNGKVFRGLFESAIKDVIETDNKVTQDVQALATGQSDNLHELQIDMNKAQLSLSLLVQLRNRTMEAYNELMRISL